MSDSAHNPPTPANSLDETEQVSVRLRGPWNYQRFALQVLRCAHTNGDDAALALIRNTFPPVGMDDARLWLAYMKAFRPSEYDAVIMNAFPTTSFVRFIRQGNHARLFPELIALLPQLRDPAATSPQDVQHAHPSGPQLSTAPSTSHPAYSAQPHLPDPQSRGNARGAQPQSSYAQPTNGATRLISAGHTHSATNELLDSLPRRGIVNIILGTITIQSMTIQQGMDSAVPGL